MKRTILQTLTLLVLAFSLLASAQSGGNFTIAKSVVAGGGGQAAGGAFALNGTLGEPFGGAPSTGGAFSLVGGFWGGGTAAPISTVSISGRIFTSDGVTGLRNASVILTDGLGNVRTATTSTFGFYSFDNVAPGFAYSLRVSSRLFRYQVQTVVPSANLTDVNFVGLE